MSYEFLATIVLINAFVTFALWRQVGRKATKSVGLNKKAAKALWGSAPIVPRHDPPTTPGGQYSGLAGQEDRLFFKDFREFADVVNRRLADEFTRSSFRLQDLPDGDLRLNVDFDNGPTLGHCLALYYNQTRVGRLEISPGYPYTTETPLIYTNIEIEWARFFGFDELTEFLGAIALHVTSSDPKRAENLAERQAIMAALTQTLWGEYRISQYDRAVEDVEDWGELNVCLQGVAEFYMRRK
jgi:hypothetical protein